MSLFKYPGVNATVSIMGRNNKWQINKGLTAESGL